MVLAAFCLIVLIAMAGLVIDSGRAYLVRARLSAATDAAANAALRAATATDDAHADGAAQDAAAAAFAANFPDGWLGAAVRLSPPQLTTAADGMHVHVDAAADMPTGLMAAVGFASVPVTVDARARRRGIDVALALDLSSGQAASAPQLTEAAGLLLRQLSPALDRVALVRYGYGAQVDAPMRATGRGFDRAALQSRLASFDLDGCANSAEGLWQARDALMRVQGDPATPQALVLFAGNAPGALAARFAFADPDACLSAGVLAGAADGSVSGLWHAGRQAEALPGACADAAAPDRLAPDALPPWYNAHGEDRGIPLAGDAGQRAPTAANLRRAAATASAAIARLAHANGIRIHVIGLGQAPDGTRDGDLLRCLANTGDAPPSCRDAAQPTGRYCHARSAAELKPCVTLITAELLRGAR
jgi:Flp pilus assembly protein TadG